MSFDQLSIAICHTVLFHQNSVIGKGANVNIAIFKLDDYAAECERTFFTEEPSEEEKRYFNIMMEAREMMVEMLYLKVKASAIEEKIMDYFESQGVADKVLITSDSYCILTKSRLN
ncbi:M24 family metallopeptidase [Tetragenococcus solitarius]|uniref:Peptidase M24 domain-containing protein n=1 Tax=Tetragenococcus solitarius TaxID=71453 RepID=A0ABN3Y481_9ENTE|nr:M24 family metallopeptidase [Tetragenococcus solitarius]